LTEAQIEFEKAIARDPNNTRAILQSGITLIFLGRPKAALPYLKKSLQLNPAYQNVFYRYYWSGFCHLLLGDADTAIDHLRKSRAAYPQGWGALILLAAALGLRGDIDEAKATLAESIKLHPEVSTIARVRAVPIGSMLDNPELVALQEKTMFAGLRRAGMPEE
jgi:tetratricopeptide (TPR) repeat protein